MTIEQLRAWLRDWVSQATGVAATEILDSTPLENYGLSSRDAVVLSGELENLLGTRLDATVAYEYPTIELLANRLLTLSPRGGATMPRACSARLALRRVLILRLSACPVVSQVPKTCRNFGPCSRNRARVLVRCRWGGGLNTAPIR